ncbi:MAG: ABC transporter substrate binding protein [bacterium]
MRPRRVRASLAALAAVVLGAPAPARAAADVVAFGFQGGEVEQAVLDGLRAGLARRPLTLETRVVPLAPEAARAAVTRAVGEGARVLLTAGPRATEAAVAAAGSVPIVSTLVLGGSVAAPRGNLTGVSLDFPVDVQVSWLVRLLPDRKVVGLLYDPAQNQHRADAFVRALTARGLTPVVREVGTPAELPEALRVITNRAEVLLALPDTVVLSRETSQALLLASFENRVPFVGLSEGWVKAGALYSLERDYRDVGLQAAEILARVLGGEAPSSIPIVAPRRVVYVLNRRTAEQMKIKLDPTLVAGAARVIE